MRENLTGQENEYVKYIEDVADYVSKGKRYRKAKWKCKRCGKIFEATVKTVKRKNGIKSCGCLRKEHFLTECEKENIRKRNREKTRRKIFDENKRFGFLIPIDFAEDYIEPNGERNTQIRCKCENCGSETIVRASHLLDGHTISCGCFTSSVAAQNIKRTLISLGVSFISELRLPGCFNPETEVLLPFDFAILDSNQKVKFLIEYQGAQHYIDYGWFGKLERETTDKIKRNFCQTNNIPLQEIRYDEDEIAALKNILKEAL